MRAWLCACVLRITQSDSARAQSGNTPASTTTPHSYIQGDFNPLHAQHYFDLVVSNPPYIPRGDMDTLQPEVREFEDHRALCGGGDGLDIVREIIRELPGLIDPARLSTTYDGPNVWLEVRGCAFVLGTCDAVSGRDMLPRLALQHIPG